MTATPALEDQFDGTSLTRAFQDPYPILRAAREGAAAGDRRRLWAVDRLRGGRGHPAEPGHRPLRGGSSWRPVRIAGDAGGAEAAEIYLSMFIAMDAPDHTRLRRLASPAFRPSIVQQFRVLVDEIVAELVDGMLEKGEADFVQDFAYPLPQTVICRMLGVPAQDEAQWNQWGLRHRQRQPGQLQGR